MLETLLVAVDFSPSWPRLERQLVRLRGLGCKRLALVHVIASGYGQVPPMTHREYYAEQLETAAAALHEAGFEQVDTEVRVGQVGVELEHAAAGLGAGAIIAGTRGHRTLRSLLLGSTVHALARTATRPLLLIPTADDSDLPSAHLCRPMLATDGSAAARAAEEAFIALLPACQRGLIVSVVGPDANAAGHEDDPDIEAHLASLCERCASPGCDQSVIPDGNAAAAIASLAAAKDIDLIVLGKRGRNPARDLLLGRTAEAVCQHAGRMVLLVPAT
ncbi:MAG: universal stress protein [Gammaproteobacteria bacterium]|nr:universal stress protein [Gammaproteobacteria bacterium]